MKFPIFHIASLAEYNSTALDIYQYQRDKNAIYNKYCELINVKEVNTVSEIPFLPISFFKEFNISTQPVNKAQIVFMSSGTTGATASKHYVADLSTYNSSLDHSFKLTYGDYKDYTVLALLPHYLDRSGSSLVHMAQRWIELSKDSRSGFYLNNLDKLATTLVELKKTDKPVLLIGVTFALLDLADKYPNAMDNLTIIETGGMKGLRKEMIRAQLQDILKSAFPNAAIHSEYGMTELLSQAYALNGTHFKTPPWMQVSARETNDPLSNGLINKTGGLNIIDLANYESCPFIATQDLGRVFKDGTFEVLGRFDHSDIRGCNLMALD